MDVSKIENPVARAFSEQFFASRAINREFYDRVPENKLDYRMVDTQDRKSDSPRESLTHQIYVTRKYIYGVRTGSLAFDGVTSKELPKKPEEMTKDELLAQLDEAGQELLVLLSEPDLAAKKVKVTWSKEPVPAIQALGGLESHEVLHTGWNLAIMDHLGIERFPELKEMWG